MRRWLHRPAYCPDKKCRPLATFNLVEGGTCIGAPRHPTDHILEGVNNMSWCFKQGGRHQWHFNLIDAMVTIELIAKALKAQNLTLPGWLIAKLPIEDK